MKKMVGLSLDVILSLIGPKGRFSIVTWECWNINWSWKMMN